MSRSVFLGQFLSSSTRSPFALNSYKRLFQSTRDPYEVLGVSRSATSNEIKSAYTKLIKLNHPDLHPGRAEQFKEIQEAYSRIKDPKNNRYEDSSYSTENPYRTDTNRSARTNFDSSRYKNWTSSSKTYGDDTFNKREWFTRSSQYDVSDNIDDFLKTFFGENTVKYGNQEARTSHNKVKQRHSVYISFLESCLGTSTIISLKKCTECDGTGINDFKYIICQQCGGRGVMNMTRGSFSAVIPCPTCLKQCKTKVPIYCTKCDSKGNNYNPEMFNVAIPAGVTDKQILEFSAGKSLIQVEVNVIESSIFKRIGNDIHTSVTVDYLEAIMGAKIKTEGIRGDFAFDIPAGTGSHTVFKIPGGGVKDGSHMITVKIGAPKAYNAKTAQILGDLAKTRGVKFDGTNRGFSERYIDGLMRKCVLYVEESAFLRRLIKLYRGLSKFLSKFVK